MYADKQLLSLETALSEVGFERISVSKKIVEKFNNNL